MPLLSADISSALLNQVGTASYERVEPYGSSADEQEEKEVPGLQIHRRSTRIRVATEACQLPCCRKVTCCRDQRCDEYADEPRSAQCALPGNNKDKWFEAMSEEINMLR